MTPAEHRAEAEHIATRAQTAPHRQLLLGILPRPTRPDPRHRGGPTGRNHTPMRTIARALAPLLLACTLIAGFVAVTTTPASAGSMCIRHYSPDQGYDDPLILNTGWNGTTASGVSFPLPEGGQRCDVASIYVGSGLEVFCTYDNIHWILAYDATGWHRVYSSGQCVNNLD